MLVFSPSRGQQYFKSGQIIVVGVMLPIEVIELCGKICLYLWYFLRHTKGDKGHIKDLQKGQDLDILNLIEMYFNDLFESVEF